MQIASKAEPYAAAQMLWESSLLFSVSSEVFDIRPVVRYNARSTEEYPALGFRLSSGMQQQVYGRSDEKLPTCFPPKAKNPSNVKPSMRNIPCVSERQGSLPVVYQ